MLATGPNQVGPDSTSGKLFLLFDNHARISCIYIVP